jgi:hypothetical protein
MLDQVMRSKMLPLILKVIEDYYVTHADIPLVANQASYPIPTRAIAADLRNVEYLDPNSPNLEGRWPIERLNREDLYSSYTGNSRWVIKKNGFYIDSNSVVLFPTPTDSSTSLRLTYMCRPNQIVDTSACGQITVINGNVVTIAITPGFTTSSVLDLVSAQPHFDWQLQNVSPSAVSNTTAGATNVTLTFSSLPSTLAVGDWVCPAQQSCVVQCPVELQPLLCQYVVVQVLSAQGDAQMLQDARNELQMLEDNALLLISPRSIGQAKRAVSGRAISRWV